MVKGVPEAREGFEQRLVVHRKYKAALDKGWVKRSDKQYVDNDFILCERLVQSRTHNADMPSTISEEFISRSFVDMCVLKLTEEPDRLVDSIPVTEEQTAKPSKKKK